MVQKFSCIGNSEQDNIMAGAVGVGILRNRYVNVNRFFLFRKCYICKLIQEKLYIHLKDYMSPGTFVQPFSHHSFY